MPEHVFVTLKDIALTYIRAMNNYSNRNHYPDPAPPWTLT